MLQVRVPPAFYEQLSKTFLLWLCPKLGHLNFTPKSNPMVHQDVPYCSIAIDIHFWDKNLWPWHAMAMSPLQTQDASGEVQADDVEVIQRRVSLVASNAGLQRLRWFWCSGKVIATSQ
jgi:hypothetical protein